jgi:hypothetical protein
MNGVSGENFHVSAPRMCCYTGAMKTALIWIVVIGIVAGGFIYYRQERWDAAYKTARDAYSRAAEYKDAGTLLYEPRYKDVEMSMDKLKSVGAPTSTKSLIVLELNSCVQLLGFYRNYIKGANELYESANDLARTGNEPGNSAAHRAKDAAAIKSTVQLAKDNLRDAEKTGTEIQSCVDKGKTE